MNFVNWVRNNWPDDCSFHSQLAFKDTEYKGGGIGVFFQGPYEFGVDEDNLIEIMRIKKSFVIDLEQLRQNTHKLDVFKNALQKLMSNVEFMNEHIGEKNLLIVYVSLIYALFKNKQGVQDTVLIDELAQSKPEKYLEFVNFYTMNVLMTTTVNRPLAYSDKDKHLFKQISSFQARALGKEEQFNRFMADFLTEEMGLPVNYSALLQLYNAITSRILQTPEEVAAGSEDFQVNDTLIPVLDYVNHSNTAKNSFFDVDRVSGDIVLLFDVGKAKDRKITQDFEIFISYDSEENIGQFDYTYGFVPITGTQPQYLTITIDLNLLPDKFSNICKWFNVNPTLECKIQSDGNIQISDDASLAALSVFLGCSDFSFEVDDDFLKETKTLVEKTGHPDPDLYTKQLLASIEDSSSEDKVNVTLCVPQVRYFFKYKNAPKVMVKDLSDIFELFPITRLQKLDWINTILVPYCAKRCEYLKPLKSIPLAAKELQCLKAVLNGLHLNNIDDNKSGYSPEETLLYIKELSSIDTRARSFWSWFENMDQSLDYKLRV